MNEGMSVALTPVQLAAIINEHTLTEAEIVGNRLLGGLKLLFGSAELTGAGAMCIAPDPTFLTKAGCVMVGAHSLDSIKTALDKMLTGQDISSATYRSVAAGRRQRNGRNPRLKRGRRAKPALCRRYRRGAHRLGKSGAYPAY